MRPTGVVPQWLARPIALGGTLLFFGALIYFAYRYEMVFGRVVAGSLDEPAIAFDILLFSVFALHHSLFARDALRGAIARSVGALERSMYVWIASLLFIAVCAFWRPIAGAIWQTDRWAIVWVVRVAQLAGVWLTLRSAALIDVAELSGLRQLDAPDADRSARTTPQEFRTNGPYGWVRHPIYAGWFLLVFAVPVMTATRLAFAGVSAAYLLAAIPFEERSLRRTSGGAYERYMRHVPWKLVPGIY